MTRLFIRFYIGVLVVLFLAWYLQGIVLKQRTEADRARVYTEAHGGGARLVARELDTAISTEEREQILADLQQRFDYQLHIVSVSKLPEETRHQLSVGNDVARFGNSVVATLSGGKEVVRLGPFPNYSSQEIKESLAGWMRLTREKLEAVASVERPRGLIELQNQFAVEVKIAHLETAPVDQQADMRESMHAIAWYRLEGYEGWFSGLPLLDGENFLRFGPFPSFEDNSQTAAATALALVLLPAALAILLLLRPVARQLRQVENVAETIAGGDLSARVDQSRMNSAKPLAQAFNHMAERTELLVRTQRELLQAVSHELRTPLSRMRFAIDLIGTARDDKERQERLESLDAAAEELDGLVGELLSYVRLENAEPQLAPEVVSVRESMNALVFKFGASYPAIEFRGLDALGDDDAIVWADRPGFLRAIGNLLSNAGRHAKSLVNIDTKSEAGVTVINVDDNGEGIPASDRERVFEPFVRLENASNGNGRGVGLGLALVKRIVTQNGGAVEILQSPLGGCRISTKWPVQPHEAN